YSNVVSGTASSPLPLNIGTNQIDVLVTAQDAMTTRIYTLVVTRPSPAPVVVTQLPSNIASNSATLNGTVNPNGYPCAVWFEWGTNTNYGAQTTTNSAGNGSTNVPVSANLSGLAPATAYHFRIVATNAGGLAAGA